MHDTLISPLTTFWHTCPYLKCTHCCAWFGTSNVWPLNRARTNRTPLKPHRAPQLSATAAESDAKAVPAKEAVTGGVSTTRRHFFGQQCSGV